MKKQTVIVDKRIDVECERGLLSRGYEVIKLEPSPYLAAPVASHPDMLLFIGGGALVCERRYFEKNSDTVSLIAERGGLNVVLTDETAECEYPHDVLFNAAPIGEKLLCRKASTSERILEMYPDGDIANIKQGYAKCSCLTVGDGGVITADPSVAKGALDLGLDMLKLCSHGVRLSGYDSGFIGGASGDDGESILFCGSFERHPEGDVIADFCRRHQREPVSLSANELYDYGSLLFI